MNAKRGDLWTVAGGGDFLSKPRPVVIIQSDNYRTDESVTICPLSTGTRTAIGFRVRIEPDERNGLLAPSVAMGDRVTTVRVSRIGRQIGHLDAGDLALVEAAVAAFLGISRGPP